MKFLFAMVVLTLGIIDAGLAKPRVSWRPNLLNDVVCVSWSDCSEPCNGGTRRCERSNGKEWNLDCHLHDCTDAEDCGRADLVFILDDSTSIAERDFWVTKQFAIDVMKGLNIGPEFSRIGMVTFSDDATTQWDLPAYDSEDALEDAIWSLPKIGGNTNTAEGLRHAQQIIEETSRPGVKHIVVIITDGVANLNQDITIPQAEEMHEQGIEIFAIGIGAGIDEDELRGIASEIKDDHMHVVPDYTALTHITKVVINETCAAANKTECDEWSEWGPCEVRDGGCGAGFHSRYRECRFYNYEGADPIRRIDTQHLECELPCGSTPQPPHTNHCVNWTNCDAVCDGTGHKECLRSNGHIWHIPCYGGPCEPVVCEDMDIVFILDSSNSIGEHHWWSTLQFAIDITKGLPLESTNTHVGSVTFSSEATTEWVLGEYNTKETLEEKFWELPWAQGTTNSQDGLTHAKQVFDSSGRPGLKKVAIFLSDGESNIQPERTIPAAEELHADGVNVYAIAVRVAGIDELKGIASDPAEKYYLQADTYDELVDMCKDIINEACEGARRKQ